MRLSEYKPYMASRFLDSLAPSMTRASLGHVRGVMSSLFVEAARTGRIDRNPMRDAKSKVKRKESKPQQHYTPAEMAGILTVLAGNLKAQTLMALAFVGLRPAEIVGLRWTDVTATDLEIKQSMWRSTTGPCKTERSRRSVPLGNGLRSLLERLRAAGENHSGFVLENQSGGALNTHGMYFMIDRVIRPALKAAGYEWKTLYAGRHGAVTEMNRQTKGNVQIIAPYFGHSPAMEAAVYLHGVGEDTRAAALALDAAILSDKQVTIDSNPAKLPI